MIDWNVSFRFNPLLPPPGMSAPPPAIRLGLPNTNVPPPGFSVPPPTFGQPPPGFPPARFGAPGILSAYFERKRERWQCYLSEMTEIY